MNKQYTKFLVLGGGLVLLGTIGLVSLLHPQPTQIIEFSDENVTATVRAGDVIQIDITESNSIGLHLESIEDNCSGGLVYISKKTTSTGNGMMGGDSVKTGYRYKVTNQITSCTVFAHMNYRGTAQLRYLHITTENRNYGID